MATKPIRSDAGVNCGTAGVAAWQGPAGTAGVYVKTGSGLVARRSDNTDVVLSSAPSTLYSNAAPIGSVTTGEIDAQVYTMPANTLTVDGQRLQITIGSNHAANTNTATYRLYIAGTVVINQARAISGEAEMGSITVVRASSSILRWFSSVVNGSTPSNGASSIVTDFTIANIIKTTVEGPTLAADMTSRFLRVEFWP